MGSEFGWSSQDERRIATLCAEILRHAHRAPEPLEHWRWHAARLRELLRQYEALVAVERKLSRVATWPSHASPARGKKTFVSARASGAADPSSARTVRAGLTRRAVRRPRRRIEVMQQTEREVSEPAGARAGGAVRRPGGARDRRRRAPGPSEARAVGLPDLVPPAAGSDLGALLAAIDARQVLEPEVGVLITSVLAGCGAALAEHPAFADSRRRSLDVILAQRDALLPVAAAVDEALDLAAASVRAATSPGNRRHRRKPSAPCDLQGSDYPSPLPR